MSLANTTFKARTASRVVVAGIAAATAFGGSAAADPAQAATKASGCATTHRVDGHYDDRLIGTNSADCLRGGGRADRIKGRLGHDLLLGASGRDRINSRDGVRDLVHCGPGDDLVLADTKDVLSGCERDRVRVTPVDPPVVDSSDCVVDAATLSAPGCSLIKSDTGEVADPEQLWGNIECASDSRAQRPSNGGDTHIGATGAPTTDGFFRRLSVFDGDDFYGKRCELGRNEHRFGDEGGDGTFMTYHEGERRITFLSVRLDQSLPIQTHNWQTIMQMKQAQPSANGGGGPILEMQLRDNEFHLESPTETYFEAPATGGVWTRIALDVQYSPDPDVGSVTMYVDTNGDGDAADPGEQSPVIRTATMKREIAGGWEGDGIDPGQAIPSHLRAGIYHDPLIPCATGCSIDLDNVQVVK